MALFEPPVKGLKHFLKNSVMIYTVDNQNVGDRLDKFLLSKLTDYSRSQIQKWIKSGLVLVNKQKVSPHYFLKAGESIEITKPKERKIDKAEEKKLFEQIKIIEENPEFIILYKPVGLVVHPAPSVKSPTLTDFLLKKYPEIKDACEEGNRPGLVHRLDKEVGGLMVVARTQESFLNLKKQFQNREVEKEYLALVHGVIEKEEDTINFPLKRSNKGYKMAAVPQSYKEDKGVREALSYLTVLEKYTKLTLVKIKIATGRTHQVRTHLLAYGHPIVGDKIYNTKKTREEDKKLIKKGGFPERIFLQSVYLGFKDLSGEKREFEVEENLKFQNI